MRLVQISVRSSSSWRQASIPVIKAAMTRTDEVLGTRRATAGGLLATLVVGALAGGYPAWRAARLSPTVAFAAS
jgi:hypothetical protein